MLELLQNPTLAEAIVVLKDEAPIADAIDNADAVTSVRLLSRSFGHNQCIATFLSLAEPMPVQSPESQPTFGVDLSQFNAPPKP